jgi:hypothetical protein
VWWVGDSLDVYIGARRAAVCAGDRLLHDDSLPQAPHGLQALDALDAVDSLDAVAAFDVSSALGKVSHWLGALRARRRIRVWLGGSLCRPFLLQGLQALRSAAEVDAAAGALARRAMDSTPSRFWLAPAQRGDAACLGAAASEAVVSRMETALAPLCRGRLRIAPWWGEGARVLALARREASGSVIVRDCDSLTLLAFAGDAFRCVRTAVSADEGVLEASLQRWQLSLDLDTGRAMRLSLRPDPLAPAGATGLRIALAPIVDLRR